MAALVLFGIPNINQDTITQEDIKFREYLEKEGWDVRQLGLLKGQNVTSRPTAVTLDDEDKKE